MFELVRVGFISILSIGNPQQRVFSEGNQPCRTRCTCFILMKLFRSKKKLVTNILKSKYCRHVTSENTQKVDFLGGSNFKNQDLKEKIKTMSYCGIW